MTEGIAAALRDLASAFEGYPRRPVLERCPHCGPPVRVAEADLFWLSLKLGNTVGEADDVKALLPLLFERLVTTDELDPGTVLGKLSQLDWRSWPVGEQAAVDGLLDQVWLALLAECPSRVGAFADAADFLGAVAAVPLPVDRFLVMWDDAMYEAADRRLAEFVIDALPARRLAPDIRAWLTRESLRDGLLLAFEGGHADSEWADAFARAYDLATAFIDI